MIFFLRRARPFLLLAGACLLMLAAVCANRQQIFADAGGVDFVDADCYSRMTRVREVCAHPGEVIRQHAFENYPFGTRPHTTVPFDYAVYALRVVLQPFYGERALDLAGAWISPLLGLGMVLGVWLWAERERLPGRVCALLVLAASPILAHGFALGRPDHQSLIAACMAWALAAEWTLWRRPSRGWGIVSGAAWALGLWTSLYEPVILLAAVVVVGAIWNRAMFRQRARLPGLAAGGMILLAALWIEGWRIDALPGEGEGGGYFAAWSRQIGELASVPPWSGVLFAWTGWGLIAAPVLLWRRWIATSGRDGESLAAGGSDCPTVGQAHRLLRGNASIATDAEERESAKSKGERPVTAGGAPALQPGQQGSQAAANDLPSRPEVAIHLSRANLFLLLLVWALTCWQVRWGYFLPLVYVLGVPWQFAAIAPRWRPWLTAALLLLLWPMASEWRTTLHPTPERTAALAEQRTDADRLREVAAFIRQASKIPAADADPNVEGPAEGILAPWWLSPALAYWSGQPALAGSSHESLPGTVDTDKFYVAADAREAAAILRRRRVRWVVAYEPDRVLRTASDLLGQPQIPRRAMDNVLYQRPDLAPTFLRLALVNPFFKVYEVRSAFLPPAP